MRFDLHYFIQQFNLAYQMELLLRIVIACILGYMIGYERKSRDKSAGIWTTAGGWDGNRGRGVFYRHLRSIVGGADTDYPP